MNETPAIALKGVGVRRNGTALIEDVTLAVARGTIHAVVGPNGGGKTTLLRAILGELDHQGEIALDLGPEGRIGYVPQVLDFDRTAPITVLDFLALALGRRPAFLGPSRAVREAALRALATAGAGALGDRPLGVLSGGEFQRVLLAQALVPPPRLLLLDEPSGSVDEAGTIAFEETVRRIRSDLGITIVMVSHDLDQVARLADRVTSLNRRVLFTGTPSEVLRKTGGEPGPLASV